MQQRQKKTGRATGPASTSSDVLRFFMQFVQAEMRVLSPSPR